ncbi:recombination directionality factor [Pseudoduganella namucuonensis]|uniref:Uncharacterized protein n=1 Tax=Pseudoduganella namucuonensis TaxID=1035707 RepID=A0A1I7M7C0_9BURK|nr:hypothetical protein [Pseudoduganella namucuonensis]SFV17825.1 hypothetical protein SAMN05216552_10763 [Pseudoduganella namucuonensis]
MNKPMVAAQNAALLPTTILGHQPPRIPTAGKIRAGIKVLTKAAAANPAIRALYEDGLAHSATFEQIERKIAERFPDVKTPLAPKNVAWFTVRPNDFPNPALAGQILDAHGEDRGDGEVRLYRFPVIFPADAWQSVMPHELACWARSEKRYWSEYSSDGQTRRCMMFSPAKVDQRSQRALRTFGGRGTQPRPENDGLCDPERCPEFQSRQCNLSGRFIFYIPGIRSLDAFELHTNSFYALSRAIERFEAIAFMRGGRIAGFLDRQRTPFYLTKKLREVSHLDAKTGQPVRSAHWIIELEAPVDVAALLAQHDEHGALRLADEAARTLQGNAPAESAFHSYVETGETDAPAPVQATEPTANAIAATSAAPATKPEGAGHAAVYAIGAELGVDRGRLDAYLDWAWGAGWCRNAQGIKRVLAELTNYRGDPDGLRARIDVEIGPQQKEQS